MHAHGVMEERIPPIFTAKAGDFLLLPRFLLVDREIPKPLQQGLEIPPMQLWLIECDKVCKAMLVEGNFRVTGMSNQPPSRLFPVYDRRNLNTGTIDKVWGLKYKIYQEIRRS